MRYAKIREMDISNGEGVGVSLFVQGCHFHCHGCFNPETWDFSGGKEWTKDVERKFIDLAGKPYVKRISILGGEPLADENIVGTFDLCIKLKNQYPEKKIWLYTGYTIEHILRHASTLADHGRRYILDHIDVLVDGQFELGKQDLLNEEIVFAGSTNQRVIDMKSTFREERIILLNDTKVVE